MGPVYTLTLRQLFSRWRLLVMTLLAAMPVVITALLLQTDDAPSVAQFETVVLSAMLAGAIAPLIVLAIASAAFANEVEDRTLANLTLSPIPRWRIVVPKLAACLTIAAPAVAVCALATAHVAFLADWTATLSVTAAALIGVALYASAFVWLGLVTPQAIGVGLLYIVLWEGFLSGFVSGVRLLSIRHYALAWMQVLDPRRFAASNLPGLGVLSAVTALVFGGFLVLSVRRLRQMDVP